MPYLFSLHSGIFVSSTSIFIVYALVKRNNPFATPDLCLPALGSGLIWSVDSFSGSSPPTCWARGWQGLSQPCSPPVWPPSGVCSTSGGQAGPQLRLSDHRHRAHTLRGDGHRLG